MEKKICNVEGCNKPIKARGMCSTHWTRWYRKQKRPIKIRYAHCTVENCTKKHYGKGMCVMHWTRYWRYKDVSATAKEWNYGADCSMEGCKIPARKRRMCSNHYDRWMKQNSPDYKEKSQKRELLTKRKEFKKEYYKENKDVFSQRGKEYWKSPKGKALSIKKGALRRSNTKITDITSEFLQELSEKTISCEVCSKSLGKDRHLDHIIPLNDEGLHVRENVRYIHAKCNLERPKDGSDIKPR